MSERLALYLQDAHTIREGIDIARYAEDRGFEAVWQADSRLVRDAMIAMAAFATSTETSASRRGGGRCVVTQPGPARIDLLDVG